MTDIPNDKGDTITRSPVRPVYGQELILDLHECDIGTFSRDSFTGFFVDVCKLIGMTRCDLHFWDDEGAPESEKQTSPHTQGFSAVQFILTSSIVIHALTQLKAVYLNVFSCSEFDCDMVAKFATDWFKAGDCVSTTVSRR